MKKYSENDLKKAFNDGVLYGRDELELDTAGRETSYEVWKENFESELKDHIFIDWGKINLDGVDWDTLFAVGFYFLFFVAITVAIIITKSATPLLALILMPSIKFKSKKEKKKDVL